MFKTNNVLIYEFDFLTEYPRHELLIPFGFKYLTFLSNGTVNPFCNYVETIKRFYLEFNDNDEINLDYEFKNFILTKNKRIIWLTYIKGLTSPSQFEGGYGKFYIILHKEENFIPLINKMNPYWEFDRVIEASTDILIWLGVKRLSIEYETHLPYIPLGYKQMAVNFYSNAVSSRILINEYPEKYNNLAREVVSTTSPLTAVYDIYGSSRYEIQLTNNDLVDKTFKAFINFYNRPLE